MNSKSNLITQDIEINRIAIAHDDLLNNQSKYCQYFTPSKIAKFMVSLFNDFPQKIKMLDPGFGIGSLSAAFIEEVIRRNSINNYFSSVESLELVAFEIDKHLKPYINRSLTLFSNICSNKNLSIKNHVYYSDFINYYAPKLVDDLFKISGDFSHVIMNPPYGKIRSDSKYHKLLNAANINASNLYSGFVSLSIELLKDGGEIVAIIPRSFCNGPYFESFRKFLLEHISLEHIHLFVNRDDVFNENDVLQETIIIHGKKNSKKNQEITISSSKNGDFNFSSKLPPPFFPNHENKFLSHIESESLTIRNVPYENVIRNNDPQKLIYIAPTEYDQLIEDRLRNFSRKHEDLNVSISTGPVVNFRSQEHLLSEYKENSAPLIYPNNAKLKLIWPIESKKPSAIEINNETKNKIWENKGFYLIVNRFSSKEEKRRIKATLVDTSQLPGKYIAFDNKLNVFHREKCGFEEDLAKGLFVYLNSSLLDKYYRQFGGHTQVNANDLKSINYPSLETLLRMGSKLLEPNIEQGEIDKILDLEIENMTSDDSTNPLELEKKINEALAILKTIGMPRAQLNDRTALTLLALLNLTPEKTWSEIERPLMGVTPIMDWIRDHYRKDYAPNTRETIRRQSLHQFLQSGIIESNPDDPERPTNSPYFCYQVTKEFYSALLAYNTYAWESNIQDFKKERPSLVDKYRRVREVARIPVELPEEENFTLSPGSHSKLIEKIISSLRPRFASDSDVIYIGDTGGKTDYYKKEIFESIGVFLDDHGKMPDVILIDTNKKWLYLIESVTSHGPVDPKRYIELRELFGQISYGLIYISCFEDRSTFSKYVTDISWETEVWIADSPDHLIHFDGENFLGPYEK